MAEIVNHVARGRPSSKAERERYRKGVRRVLEALIEAKCVQYKPGRANRSPILYRWVPQVGHEVAQTQDEIRDNSPGEVASASSA